MRKRSTEFSPITQLSAGNVRCPNSKRSDHKSILAQIISTKLEDGNLWAAIRLVCSDDVPATPAEDTPSIHHLSIGPKLGWC